MIKTFWDYVDRSGDCWLWTGAQSRGYGCIKRNGKQRKAHRVSYELTVGPIPEGKVVRHRCHQSLCVRPGHLLLGSVANNNADRRERREALERAQSAALVT